MKTFITAIIFFAWCLGAAAQGIANNPEVLPQYPEGNSSLFKFINEQMTYSEQDKENKIEGEMIVTFTVESDGKLSDVSIRKGLSPTINSKLVDVINKMPAWRPARTGGEWVNARYTLALVIQSHDQLARPLF